MGAPVAVGQISVQTFLATGHRPLIVEDYMRKLTILLAICLITISASGPISAQTSQASAPATSGAASAAEEGERRIVYLPDGRMVSAPASVSDEEVYRRLGFPTEKALGYTSEQGSLREDSSSDFSQSIIWTLPIMLILSIIALYSLHSRSIDRQKVLAKGQGHVGSIWIYEWPIWMFPPLVFWRRIALNWSWYKVGAFLLWVIAANLLSDKLVTWLFPDLIGVSFYVAFIVPYGLLAMLFCLLPHTRQPLPD